MWASLRPCDARLKWQGSSLVSLGSLSLRSTLNEILFRLKLNDLLLDRITQQQHHQRFSNPFDWIITTRPKSYLLLVVWSMECEFGCLYVCVCVWGGRERGREGGEKERTIAIIITAIFEFYLYTNSEFLVHPLTPALNKSPILLNICNRNHKYNEKYLSGNFTQCSGAVHMSFRHCTVRLQLIFVC